MDLHTDIQQQCQAMGDQDGWVTFHKFRKTLHIEEPFIAQKMYGILKKQKRGFHKITVDDMVEIFTSLNSSSWDQKLQFLFSIFDFDGDGYLNFMDLENLVEFLLYESHFRICRETTHGIVEAVYNQTEKNNFGLVCFSNVLKAFEPHKGFLEKFNITPKTFTNMPFARKTLGERKACCHGDSWLLSNKALRNNISTVVVCMFYMLVHIGIGLYVVYQLKEGNISTFKVVAVVSGQFLHLNSFLALFLTLKHLIDYLQCTSIGYYLPLHQATMFHRVVGYAIVIYTVLHTGMQLLDFRYLANLPYSSHTFIQYAFSTLPGIGWVAGTAAISGWALVGILVFICIFSLPCVRDGGHFEVFYWFHCLHYFYWILLVLHSPSFWKLLILPAVLFVMEKITSSKCVNRLRYKKAFVKEAVVLPSKTIQLVIHRPQNLYFRAGECIYLQVPKVSKREWHKFIVTSAPENTDILWLHISDVDPWHSCLGSNIRKLVKKEMVAKQLKMKQKNKKPNQPLFSIYKDSTVSFPRSSQSETPMSSVYDDSVFYHDTTAKKREVSEDQCDCSCSYLGESYVTRSMLKREEKVSSCSVMLASESEEDSINKTSKRKGSVSLSTDGNSMGVQKKEEDESKRIQSSFTPDVTFSRPEAKSSPKNVENVEKNSETDNGSTSEQIMQKDRPNEQTVDEKAATETPTKSVKSEVESPSSTPTKRKKPCTDESVLPISKVRITNKNHDNPRLLQPNMRKKRKQRNSRSRQKTVSFSDTAEVRCFDRSEEGVSGFTFTAGKGSVTTPPSILRKRRQSKGTGRGGGLKLKPHSKSTTEKEKANQTTASVGGLFATQENGTQKTSLSDVENIPQVMPIITITSATPLRGPGEKVVEKIQTASDESNSKGEGQNASQTTAQNISNQKDTVTVTVAGDVTQKESHVETSSVTDTEPSQVVTQNVTESKSSNGVTRSKTDKESSPVLTPKATDKEPSQVVTQTVTDVQSSNGVTRSITDKESSPVLTPKGTYKEPSQVSTERVTDKLSQVVTHRVTDKEPSSGVTDNLNEDSASHSETEQVPAACLVESTAKEPEYANAPAKFESLQELFQYLKTKPVRGKVTGSEVSAGNQAAMGDGDKLESVEKGERGDGNDHESCDTVKKDTKDDASTEKDQNLQKRVEKATDDTLHGNSIGRNGSPFLGKRPLQRQPDFQQIHGADGNDEVIIGQEPELSVLVQSPVPSDKGKAFTGKEKENIGASVETKMTVIDLSQHLEDLGDECTSTPNKVASKGNNDKNNDQEILNASSQSRRKGIDFSQHCDDTDGLSNKKDAEGTDGTSPKPLVVAKDDDEVSKKIDGTSRDSAFDGIHSTSDGHESPALEHIARVAQNTGTENQGPVLSGSITTHKMANGSPSDSLPVGTGTQSDSPSVGTGTRSDSLSVMTGTHSDSPSVGTVTKYDSPVGIGIQSESPVGTRTRSDSPSVGIGTRSDSPSVGTGTLSDSLSVGTKTKSDSPVGSGTLSESPSVGTGTLHIVEIGVACKEPGAQMQYAKYLLNSKHIKSPANASNPDSALVHKEKADDSVLSYSELEGNYSSFLKSDETDSESEFERSAVMEYSITYAHKDVYIFDKDLEKDDHALLSSDAKGNVSKDMLTKGKKTDIDSPVVVVGKVALGILNFDSKEMGKGIDRVDGSSQKLSGTVKVVGTNTKTPDIGDKEQDHDSSDEVNVQNTELCHGKMKGIVGHAKDLVGNGDDLEGYNENHDGPGKDFDNHTSDIGMNKSSISDNLNQSSVYEKDEDSILIPPPPTVTESLTNFSKRYELQILESFRSVSPESDQLETTGILLGEMMKKRKSEGATDGLDGKMEDVAGMDGVVGNSNSGKPSHVVNATKTYGELSNNSLTKQEEKGHESKISPAIPLCPDVLVTSEKICMSSDENDIPKKSKDDNNNVISTFTSTPIPEMDLSSKPQRKILHPRRSSVKRKAPQPPDAMKGSNSSSQIGTKSSKKGGFTFPLHGPGGEKSIVFMNSSGRSRLQSAAPAPSIFGTFWNHSQDFFKPLNPSTQAMKSFSMSGNSANSSTCVSSQYENSSQGQLFAHTNIFPTVLHLRQPSGDTESMVSDRSSLGGSCHELRSSFLERLNSIHSSNGSVIEGAKEFFTDEKMEVVIDGPYGPSQDTILLADHAVIVATDTCVTQFASLLQSIVHHYHQKKKGCRKCGFGRCMNLTKVDFYWINQSQYLSEWFLGLITQLQIEQCQLIGDGEGIIDFHICAPCQHGCIKSKVGMEFILDLFHKTEVRDMIKELKSGMQTKVPNWKKVFRRLSAESQGHVAVICNGPTELVLRLQKLASRYGFDFHKQSPT